MPIEYVELCGIIPDNKKKKSLGNLNYYYFLIINHVKCKLGPRLSAMIQGLVWCSTAGSILLKKLLLRCKKVLK